MKKLACFALSLLLLCSLAGCGPAGYEELTAAALPLSDKELEDEYAKMAEQYGMEVDKVKAIVSAEALSGDLKISNALEFLKKNAKVKKPASKKKAAEEKAAEETEAPAESAE